MPKPKLPRLPQLLPRKIYKTGQTRGADDDVIYQNRVSRNSTVLIPYSSWKKGFVFPSEGKFENSFIILISPEEFFSTKDIKKELEKYNSRLGENALVFYETREQWNKYNPQKLHWSPAKQRISPLGGNYVARVPATTAIDGGEKIIHGFTQTTKKGAGIRVFEYASSKTIKFCRLQLEALFWLCYDSSETMIKHGMTKDDISMRKNRILTDCAKFGLLDYTKLINARVINKKHKTICPLCLETLSSEGFLSRMEQAVGREVPDLTVTLINLFHIEELRVGVFNHHPYNIGWGHHHCNVVTRDMGIKETISWMNKIIEKNKKEIN